LLEAFVPTPDGRIYVEREGNPSGRVVVLACGGPGTSHDHYHPWFSRLAFSRLATGASVVYFDYSGCGRSDRLDGDSEYSISLFARNIEAVRQHTESESIDLVGLSFGGLPAVEYALGHPGSVRRLVLSNAQISAESWQRTNIDGVNLELQRLFPEEWRRILRLREEGVRSLDPEYQALVAGVLPDLEWVDPWGHPTLEQPSEGGFQERVYSSVIGPDPEWEVEGTLRGYDPLPRLQEIGAPTLVISGRYDRVTPPSVAQAIFDGLTPGKGRLYIFERSAHRPWAEQPDEYFEVVGRFLD
jgi:proline iminopeptidase